MCWIGSFCWGGSIRSTGLDWQAGSVLVYAGWLLLLGRWLGFNSRPTASWAGCAGDDLFFFSYGVGHLSSFSLLLYAGSTC